jgi:hypothetical protein
MATDVDRAAIPFGLSIAILDAVERALLVQGRM